ncbi:MAG: cation:proton antiporter [Armatimonadetes bacterium]|nr:cation:proton antiporter [Armatimonadota bacterium]MDE2205005.1 cation:proton antiporter [Armatimonadota bacterium]
MTQSMERFGLLLLVAALVALIARRFKLPYTAGLVAAGLVIGGLRLAPSVTLTPSLLFNALLPPIIFDAAIRLRWSDLRHSLPLVLVLTTFGVVISATVTAAGMRWLAGWPMPAAMMFGALIAATDPLSVIATLKDMRIGGRFRTILEAESLLNDGSAAILFALAADMVRAHQMPVRAMLSAATFQTCGSVLLGIAFAITALFFAGRSQDHLVELTFTTLTAWGAFLTAGVLGLSGIVAVLTAGLVMGNAGTHSGLTPAGHEAVDGFWEYAAFIANSIAFLLLGIAGAREPLTSVAAVASIAVIVVLAARAVAVAACCLPFARLRRTVSLRGQALLVMGGLRGALALALAMVLPSALAHRNVVQAVTFIVAGFSVLVQSFAIAPLARRLPNDDAGASRQPAASPSTKRAKKSGGAA